MFVLVPCGRWVVVLAIAGGFVCVIVVFVWCLGSRVSCWLLV